MKTGRKKRKENLVQMVKNIMRRERVRKRAPGREIS